jgi:carbohydrate kinase (thermoresistant glucokinase family)
MKGRAMGPRNILLMGVSGSGKTTVGRLLAERLGGRYLDADDLHAPEAVAKMRAGVPLDDDDRWPWLDRVAAAMRDHQGPHGDQEPLVVGCSALKESYRRRLGRGNYALVYLRGNKALIAERMKRRRGHFMPPELLDSQFAALEEPEDALTVDIDATPEAIVDRVVAGLSGDTPPPSR